MRTEVRMAAWGSALVQELQGQGMWFLRLAFKGPLLEWVGRIAQRPPEAEQPAAELGSPKALTDITPRRSCMELPLHEAQLGEQALPMLFYV